MSDYSSAVQTLGEWEQSIGAAIRRLRIDAGLDQEALADRANVSRSSVQALEGGKGTRLRTHSSPCCALWGATTYLSPSCP